MKKLTYLCIVFILNSFACLSPEKGFYPDNDMRVSEYAHFQSGIDQSRFNQLIDKGVSVYAPIVRRFGGNLKVSKLWSNEDVNARASRQGANYLVEMYGGLARHPEMTEDGFMLVLCHEIGHHIGGVPRVKGSQGLSWASNEGQSDYFASLKCLRKVFMNDDNENIVRQMQVGPTAKKKCEEKFSSGNDIAICIRSSMAGLAVTRLFASSSGRMPSFSTPDPGKVFVTNDKHPAPQCRLDTYFGGAICPIEERVDIGQNNPNEGTCNRPNGDDEGLRSLCWYKPSGGSTPIPDPTDPTDPPPSEGDVATTPSVNGSLIYETNNPKEMVPIKIDLRNMNGAVGFAFEVSKPGKDFLNPNGTSPDRQNGLGFKVISGLYGTYKMRPSRELPRYGSYKMRVIALDRGKNPVGKFSNDFTLVISR